MSRFSLVCRVGVVVASAVVLLGACGSGDGGASSSSSSGSGSGEVVEIEYLHRLPDGDGMTPVAEIVDRWNAQNPGIQVTATKFDGQAQDLIKKVQTDTSAGGAACLYQAGYADLAELYVGGLVQDVTEYAGQYAADFGEGPFQSMSLDGKFFGLPQDTGPLVYFYNKAAFGELGLEVPVTSEEFVETAKAAAAKGKYIVTFQTDEAGSLFPALSAAAGDQWFGIDGDAWTVSLDGAGTQKVADFYQQLLDADAAPVVERWGTEWGTMLNDGTVIGTIGAAWEAPLLAGDMEGSGNVGNWAVAQLPDFGAGAASGPNGGSGVVVSSTCEHPAEAMEFNAWFNTQVDDLASQGLVVAATKQPAAPAYAEFYGGQDVLSEFNTANKAMNAFVYIPGWSAVWGALGESAAAAGDGTIPVAELLAKVSQTATEAITNAGLTVK